jgi:hypothetical protein
LLAGIYPQHRVLLSFETLFKHSRNGKKNHFVGDNI